MAPETRKSKNILVSQFSDLSRPRQPFEPGDCRCLASVESGFAQDRRDGISQFPNFTKAAKSPGDKILAIVECVRGYRFIDCIDYYSPGSAPIDQGRRTAFGGIDAAGECR